MSSSKKHVQRPFGRNAHVRRRKNSRSRKRRGTFYSNLSFSFKALCVLSVIFAALASVTFTTDSFKLPPRPVAKTGGSGEVFAPSGLEKSTAEPAMEILAPQNPQRGLEANAAPERTEGNTGAAVSAERSNLVQDRPANRSNENNTGARTLPNQGRATRDPGAATETAVPPRHSVEPTMEPVVDITPAPTMEPITDATLAPTMEPAMDTPLAGANPVTGMVNSWKVLDGIPQTDQALGLRESQWAEDSYFNDTIFIGDSVTQKLQQYVTERRKTGDSNLLGNARFIAVQSLGTHTALANISEKSLHPTVRGTKMTIENALATLNAQKAYIMLGMNDVAVSGMETSVSNMLKFLQRIQSKVPNIEIFVQSATPRLSGSQPTTEQLFDYNLRVYEEILKLNDPKIHFVDVAYVMRDDTGKLYEDYCSDKTGMALHFTNAGCEKWVEYLYTHAYT